MAIKFELVKAGDVLYDVGRQKAGNTTMRRTVVWRVHVFEVDVEKRRALVSWNGNPKKWYTCRQIERLRRSPPKAKQ